MITIHKASSVSERSQRRPRKQQQHHPSLLTLHKAHPSQVSYQWAEETRYCQYKALRVTGPYSINTIKSNQNVHLESNGQAQHVRRTCQTGQSQSCEPMTYSSSQKSASKHFPCCTLQHSFASPTALVSWVSSSLGITWSSLKRIALECQRGVLPRRSRRRR